MSETMKRFIGAAVSLVDAPTSKGELVVPIEELATIAERAHNEVEAAAETAVLKGLEAGKALRRYRFTIRTAQSYMRLALQEDKVRQLLDAKAKLGSRLSMKEALKYLNTLNGKKRR
jgi:hypothetical protein